MTEQTSLAEIFANLSDEEREEALSVLTPQAKAELKYNWEFWARPNQLEPEGDWNTWMILAGRGFGKTRVGAETIRKWVCGDTPLSPGRCSRIALVAETAADARDVMIKGASGILANHPKDFRPEWSPTNRCLTWPNGAQAWTYNATEPDQLRGPQHDGAWVDELAKFRYAQDIWDQLMFGLRLGEKPRAIVTTTPRPIPIVKKLYADPRTHVTKGVTLDNAANLASSTVEYLYEKYSNTRLGRQELEGEILGDIPGALWTRESIDDMRLMEEEAPDMERIYVAVDPAASSHEGSDEHGIVVVGMSRDKDGYARGYVLDDCTIRGRPEDWAKVAVKAYRKYQADKIIAEKNNGGEMVEAVIKAADRSVPVKLVHASRGKHIRAEPISALYEQGRVHHVGRFDLLEDQMCLFSVDNLRDENMGSPDRVDALVWGLSEIFDKITSRRKSEPRAAKKKEYIPGWTEYSDTPGGWMGM